MAGVIGTNKLVQVAFVVKDIEVTKRKFAEFLGIDVPDNYYSDKNPHTIVKGKPAPDVAAILAFLDAGPGVQIELIQPNGVSSVWQDVLDEKGEGFHHIAFGGGLSMEEKIKACEDAGMECLQKGKGYAYMDGLADLKTLIEFF